MALANPIPGPAGNEAYWKDRTAPYQGSGMGQLGAGVGNPNAKYWSNPDRGIDPTDYMWNGWAGGAQQQSANDTAAAAAAGQRQAPGMDMGAYNANMALEGQSRGQQAYGMAAAQAAMEGRGPSAAMMQAQAGQAQQVNAGQALAASTRGGPQAQAAAAMAAQQSAGTGALLANQQGAQGRAQEQIAARGQYAQAAQAMRAADLQRAGMSADQAQRQAGMEAQQQSQNDAMVQYYLSQGWSTTQAQLAASQESEARGANNSLGLSGLQLQGLASQRARDAQEQAAGMNAAGGGLTEIANIERQKEAQKGKGA